MISFNYHHGTWLFAIYSSKLHSNRSKTIRTHSDIAEKQYIKKSTKFGLKSVELWIFEFYDKIAHNRYDISAVKYLMSEILLETFNRAVILQVISICNILYVVKFSKRLLILIPNYEGSTTYALYCISYHEGNFIVYIGYGLNGYYISNDFFRI